MKPDTTQKEIVLDFLKWRKEGVTSWDAIQSLHVTRLAAYVHMLRREGNEIVSVHEKRGRKWWVRYTLEKLSDAEAAR